MTHRFVGYPIAETGKAILFEDHFGEEPFFIPKSQVTIHRFEDTHEIMVDFTDWFAGVRGVKEYE